MHLGTSVVWTCADSDVASNEKANRFHYPRKIIAKVGEVRDNLHCENFFDALLNYLMPS